MFPAITLKTILEATPQKSLYDPPTKVCRPELRIVMANHEEIDFWKWAETTRTLGIAWINPDLTIGHCNYQFASIIGRDKYDCVEAVVSSFYPPENREHIDTSLRKLIDGEIDQDFQVRQSIFVTPTGRRVYVKVEHVLCRDSNGEIRGVLKVIHEFPSGNFTKLEQLAAELEALKEETSFIRGRGVQVLVSQDTMRDNNSVSANNQSSVKNNDSKVLKAMVVTLMLVLGLVVLGFVALVVGGQISFNGGGRIDIQP